jgi:predicted adenine nucleotide alpha hydrolase (AANH) superfamily ATPase
VPHQSESPFRKKAPIGNNQASRNGYMYKSSIQISSEINEPYFSKSSEQRQSKPTVKFLKMAHSKEGVENNSIKKSTSSS